jgi:glutaminase
MNPLHSSLNSIRTLLHEIHDQHARLDTGTLPDYIPELTRADPNWFGIAVTTVDGRQYVVGDAGVEFSIQSVSKPFTYGMAIDACGIEAVRQKIDVEPSGEAFNSISLHPETGQPRNPMINAGAIAATGMIAADDAPSRFKAILDHYSAFAGRDLGLNESIYRSESDTGFRNRAIANLLRNFNILEEDVDPVLEAYFMQCSVMVDCQSLSVMGATLANGGVNPLTGKRVLMANTVERVTSVMSSCGMYDFSGNWVFQVGIPAKSGVGGGIVGVLPGQLSVAVFSPLLDENFNSVRGIATFKDISQRFGLHLFNRPPLTDYVIRRSYTLSECQSSRFRSREAQDILRREGKRTRVFELQGDLYFSALERLIQAYLRTLDENDRVVIDLSRIGVIDEATRSIIFHFAQQAFAKGKRIVIVDPRQIFSPEERRSLVPMAFVYDHSDEALEDAEENILAQAGARGSGPYAVDFEGMELLQGLSPEELTALRAIATERTYGAEERIIETGTPPDEIYLLAEGVVGILLRQGPESEAKRVSSFSPGMSFGELSFLQGHPRTADVVAITPCRAFALKRVDLDAFNRERPQAFQALLRNTVLALSERLVRANKEVAALK